MHWRILTAITFAFAILTSAAAHAQDDRPKRLLLIGQGPDGHKPTTHEYMAGVQVLEKLFANIHGVRTKVVNADEPWSQGPELIDRADGVVMMVTQGAQFMQWVPERYEAFKRLAARGGGIAALHWAVGAKDAKYIQGQLELLGGTRGGPQRKYTVLDADLKMVSRDHPILRGIRDFSILDEFYYRLDLLPSITPLIKTQIDGNDETVCWSLQRPDGGRSFGFVGIHFHDHWKREEYRRLAVQGTLWTLKLPIPDRGVNVDIDPKHLQLEETAAQAK